MEKLENLYDLSVELYAFLMELSNHQNDREQAIKRIHIFMERREELLPFIKGPYNEAQMVLGKKILQLDEQINVKMNEILHQIQKDMKKVKEKKKLNRSYISPYGDMKTTDGMYLDSKQ